MTEGAAIEQALAYLAVFLDGERAEELAAAAAGDAEADADPVAVLSAAHRRLTAELRIADDVAADVLSRDLGLEPAQASRVLDMPPEDVREAVHRAVEIERELSDGRRDRSPPRYVFDTEAPSPAPVEQRADERGFEPPSFEAPEARPRRRVLSVVVGLAVVAALALAVMLSLRDGGPAEGPPDVTDVAGEVTITQLLATTEVTDEGPAAPQEEFAADQPVVVWFAFEPVSGEAVVELVVLRDGQELIAPSFPLPQARTDSNVTLPAVITEEPGAYRVELRRDGRVLAETGFRITPQ